jgi:hypothetical protein
VGSDDAVNGNAKNNATYKRVTVDQGSFNLVFQAHVQTTIPAIMAWARPRPGRGHPRHERERHADRSAREGTYWYAHKAKDMGNGTWRYDYAVFNLNSDRSGRARSACPVPSNVIVTDVGFSSPRSHSRDIYNNDPWGIGADSGACTWTERAVVHAERQLERDPLGTMFNFWFTANSGPPTSSATLGSSSRTHLRRSRSTCRALGNVACYAQLRRLPPRPHLN